MALFARASFVDDLFQENLSVLPKQHVNEHVEDRSQGVSMAEKVYMLENERTTDSGQARRNDDDVVV